MSILFKKSILFFLLINVGLTNTSYSSDLLNKDKIFNSYVPNPPDWIDEYAGTDEIHHGGTRYSYRDILEDHYNGETHDYCYPSVQASENGLATDNILDGINRWQIDRYQILSRIQNHQGIVNDVIADNHPMNYYLSLLRILINSACQLKDDIKNGLYVNDLNPNLNKHGLISYKGVVHKLTDICNFIIDKMIPLVDIEQSRYLIDFGEDFRIFTELNNDQLDVMYRNLRNAIQNNN